MRIYVPSYCRSDQIYVDSPLVDAGPEDQTRFVVVVRGDQFAEYRRALPSHIEVCGVEAEGISATRHEIGKIAEQNGEDKFLMLDDDVRFLVRRGPGTWKLRGTEPREVTTLFNVIEHLLDEHGHVGVSGREGNNRIGTGAMPLLATNTRTIRALAYRTNLFLSVEHGRVPVMEDFDVNLQLLRGGWQNCAIHYWAQGQKMTNAPGGCSEYRTHELHEGAARELAALHEGFVRLRTKQNKTDREGFGTRTEVTISWKKAFNSSQ